MKKIIIFSLILAMAAGAAFAQLANGISINAWGRGAFSPISIATNEDSDGNTKDNTGGVYSGIGATWGGSQVRTDWRIHGNSEHVGFTFTFTEGGLGKGDDGMHIWAKPFGDDMLKLTVGRFANDTLRGKIGSVNSGFECFSLPNNNEEDQIFNRFGTGEVRSTAAALNNDDDGWDRGGWMISSSPVEGLFIGLMINGGLDGWWTKNFSGGATRAGDAYRFMQMGAGYEIADIGHFRAQWVGGWAGKLDEEKIDEAMNTKHTYDIGPAGDLSNVGRIEAAFALTAVDNLLLDLGLKFWMPLSAKDSDWKATRGVDVSLGANFRAEAFNIAARVDAKHIAAYAGGRGDSNDKTTDSMEIDVRLTPSYDLDEVTIGADIGLRIGTASKGSNGDAEKDSSTELGFGLFVKRGFGNGHVKAGATFTTAPRTDGKTTGGRNIFRVPVVLEYAFF
jgi:hypothetical protein